MSLASKSSKDEPVNWAKKDPGFSERFASEILTDWVFLRSQRAERETRWQDAYDQWSLGKQDPLNIENYLGRANIKFPAIRKEVETMSRRILKAMFPEDYLKAEPTLTMSQDLAVANTQVVRHYFDNVMGLRQKLMPWAKQLVIYGNSPLRTYWK